MSRTPGRASTIRTRATDGHQHSQTTKYTDLNMQGASHALDAYRDAVASAGLAHIGGYNGQPRTMPNTVAARRAAERFVAALAAANPDVPAAEVAKVAHNIQISVIGRYRHDMRQS